MARSMSLSIPTHPPPLVASVVVSSKVMMVLLLLIHCLLLLSVFVRVLQMAIVFGMQY